MVRIIRRTATAAACALSLTAAALVVAPQAQAAEPCGAYYTGLTDRTMYYNNCGSSTVHKKLVINNWPDGGCKEIPRGAIRELGDFYWWHDVTVVNC